jgi:hypothetical protein
MGSWQPISQAGGNLIFAVDFDAPDRPEAGFADLAALLRPRRTIWQTVQPPAGSELSDGRDYVTWWLNGLPHQDSEIDAILGFCAGSVLAGVIATEVALRQRQRPLLVLFDPEPPTRGSLLRDFDGAIEQLGPMLADQERLQLHDTASLIADTAPDFNAFCSALVDAFSEGVTLAFAGLKGSPGFSAELAGSFRSYISYVKASHQPAVPASWTTATAMLSRTARDWVELPNKQFRFDVDSADILRDASVARAVSEALNHSI